MTIDPENYIAEDTDLAKPNWRIGYREVQQDIRIQLRKERQNDSKREVYLPWKGRTKRVANLSLAEIDRYALYKAEQSTQMAIRKQAENERIRRRRFGEGL